MVERGIPETHVLYPDEGHGFARPENSLSFNAVTEAFLVACLGGMFEPIGDDFEGSSITVPVGAEHVAGLPAPETRAHGDARASAQRPRRRVAQGVDAGEAPLRLSTMCLMLGSLMVSSFIFISSPDEPAIDDLRSHADGPVDAFAHLRDAFDGGPSDPTLRDEPWSLYKPVAIATATVVGRGALLLEPVEGGSGPVGSLWFSTGPQTQLDGLLVYKDVGPGVGTPIGFDARARLSASSDRGAAAGEYRYAVLAAHDPDRSELNYVHVGIGWDPTTATAETKTTDQDGVVGASAFAVTELPEPLEVDVRLVRRSSNVQIFDTYVRPTSSGEPLDSDEGWTLHHTVDRSDGDGPEDTIPTRAAAVPLPSDLHVGVSVYANVVGHAITAEVHEFWIGETSS